LIKKEGTCTRVYQL